MARKAEKRKTRGQVISLDEARKARVKRRERQSVRVGSVKNAEITAPKRKKHPSVLRKIYIPFFLVVLVAAGYFAIRTISLNAELDDAKEEYKAALDAKDRLETELKYINDPVYIEEEARTRLRMVKPGELLYVVQDDDGQPDGAAEDVGESE
ncbi:MAG: septum formation initiator family protein [Clostridiales Family XIII bacterium]|nr:septum formation initiator family protein [Clostridiales Family XIII bacterium]